MTDSIVLTSTLSSTENCPSESLTDSGSVSALTVVDGGGGGGKQAL